MTRLLSPRTELLALRATAHVGDEQIAAATGLPKTRIMSFFSGCRELSISDLSKIREFLIESIKRSLVDGASIMPGTHIATRPWG